MAALGRLSAAIAHEIRQPFDSHGRSLVKELARLVPLEEDEAPCHIVDRESERPQQCHHRLSQLFS